MKKYFPLKAGLLALGLLAMNGCAKNETVGPSITNIAVTNPDFQELEDAAIRGNVAVLLGNKNEDPQRRNFTVFAPTNAAFSRLGLNTAQDLGALQQSFLQKHALLSRLQRAAGGQRAHGGQHVRFGAGCITRRIIRRADGTLYVNGSKILGTDVKAANGLIHPVDKVLRPRAPMCSIRRWRCKAARFL